MGSDMNTHHGHQARKRFGQNFLHDAGVIERIVGAIAPMTGDHLVEIGPGLGALTQPLLDRAGRLDVVELDRDLAARLRQRYGNEPRLKLHEGDALRFDFYSLRTTPDERLRIVGNLPYNISTPLLFHLIDQIDCIRDIHCMLQKEVVQRMAAQPGSDDYGRLSIMIQYHCAVTPLFSVGPGAFTPQPKVDSAVVRLMPHTTPPVSIKDYRTFSRVVAQAFSARRKTLRNALRDLLDAEAIGAVADPGARPETLTLAQFAHLANAVATAQRS